MVSLTDSEWLTFFITFVALLIFFVMILLLIYAILYSIMEDAVDEVAREQPAEIRTVKTNLDINEKGELVRGRQIIVPAIMDVPHNPSPIVIDINVESQNSTVISELSDSESEHDTTVPDTVLNSTTMPNSTNESEFTSARDSFPSSHCDTSDQSEREQPTCLAMVPVKTNSASSVEAPSQRPTVPRRLSLSQNFQNLRANYTKACQDKPTGYQRQNSFGQVSQHSQSNGIERPSQATEPSQGNQPSQVCQTSQVNQQSQVGSQVTPPSKEPKSRLPFGFFRSSRISQPSQDTQSSQQSEAVPSAKLNQPSQSTQPTQQSNPFLPGYSIDQRPTGLIDIPLNDNRAPRQVRPAPPFRWCPVRKVFIQDEQNAIPEEVLDQPRPQQNNNKRVKINPWVTRYDN